MRSPRRLLLALGAAALAAAALQGATGLTDFALSVTPLLLIVGLLLSGRFVGEERILARRCEALPRLRAQLHRRWARTREQALISLLGRSPRRLRGPPAHPVAG